MNHLRKTPCHEGWDWNLCLLPLGVYGGAWLERPGRLRVEDVRVRRHFRGKGVTLSLNVGVEVFSPCEVDCRASIERAKAAEAVGAGGGTRNGEGGHGDPPGRAPGDVALGGGEAERTTRDDVTVRVSLYPGRTSIDLSLEIERPALWWPAGAGGQPLHELRVEVDGVRRCHRIGLRETRLLREPDEDGS